MFGRWKNRITIKGNKVEIRYILKDETQRALVKGRLELGLHEIPDGVKLDLDGETLVMEPTTFVTTGTVFKWIEQLTKK